MYYSPNLPSMRVAPRGRCHVKGFAAWMLLGSEAAKLGTKSTFSSKSPALSSSHLCTGSSVFNGLSLRCHPSFLPTFLHFILFYFFACFCEDREESWGCSLIVLAIKLCKIEKKKKMMCYFNEPGCALCANAPCPVYHALCTTCCAQYTMCYAATLHTVCSVHHVPCTNALCTYATCTITVLCVSVHRAPMHRASRSVHPCTVQCAKCTVTLHSVHQSTTHSAHALCIDIYTLHHAQQL